MRDRHLLATLVLASLALWGSGCLEVPQVVQGTVESYDPVARLLLVKDPGPPERNLELLLEGAEVGADPAPGDTVRVAYRDRQGRRQATRVMNITRQHELSKKAKGSGGH